MTPIARRNPACFFLTMGNLLTSMLLSFILFTSLKVGAAIPQFHNIQIDGILIGHEATFQDSEMMANDQPMTFSTPHKREKIEAFAFAIAKRRKELPQDIKRNLSAAFKPFVKMQFAQETVALTMEPGCVEANQSPKSIFEIRKAWTPIFQAARDVNLANDVYRLGTFGGGGHFHVGGRSKAENPFWLNPLMLRNVLVYTHQHPSLLYGFSEAYDMGRFSSIRALHSQFWQRQFRAAIDEFDSWYARATANERSDKGLGFLLRQLQDYCPIFFDHDVFINLEHSMAMARPGTTNEKATVEWRNFRPLENPDQVEAVAGLILKVMDKMAEPGFVVPFRMFSGQEVLNFTGPATTEYDWQLVKAELALSDPRLDEMLLAYTRNSNLKKRSYRDGKIQEAYSELARRGANEEIVLPLRKGEPLPVIQYQGGGYVAAEIVKNGRRFAAAVIPQDKRKRARSCNESLKKTGS